MVKTTIYLTSAVESISSESSITGTLVTSVSVSACSIVVTLSTVTDAFIDICGKATLLCNGDFVGAKRLRRDVM